MTYEFSIAGYILLATLCVCALIVVFGRISNRKKSAPAKIDVTVNGDEITIPMPSVESLERWHDERQTNEANPDSCEFVPGEGEIIVPCSFFSADGLAGWEKDSHYFNESRKAQFRGFRNIVVKEADYTEALVYQAESRRQTQLLADTAEMNNHAIELEKRGEIDGAIMTYEENIKLRYPAHHSYKRLMVLYRKRKDYDNEVRVIRIALEVFPGFPEYVARLEKLLAKRGEK